MMPKTPDPFSGLTNSFAAAIEWPCSAVIVLVLLSFFEHSKALGITLDFEDLPSRTRLTATTYGGLTWETGNAGIDGLEGSWFAFAGDHPFSGSNILVNAQGATRMGITFPSPVTLGGAYFAKQGNIAPTNSVRAHGYFGGQEIASTNWLSTTNVPEWLDASSFPIIDRVVFESIPVSQNGGAYGLDDLTFTYIPEPGSLTMIGLAGAGLLARRRRHK